MYHLYFSGSAHCVQMGQKWKLALFLLWLAWSIGSEAGTLGVALEPGPRLFVLGTMACTSAGLSSEISMSSVICGGSVPGPWAISSPSVSISIIPAIVQAQ